MFNYKAVTGYFLGVVFLLFSASSMACTNAYPTSSPHFCSSFKISAQCHCRNSGLPASMCSDVKLLYQRLVSTFGSIERTCAFQSDTSKENCIDSWACCMSGGKNHDGKPCNGNGQPCIA